VPMDYPNLWTRLTGSPTSLVFEAGYHKVPVFAQGRNTTKDKIVFGGHHVTWLADVAGRCAEQMFEANTKNECFNFVEGNTIAGLAIICRDGYQVCLIDGDQRCLYLGYRGIEAIAEALKHLRPTAVPAPVD